jgi:outer membrane protein assembly factor BamB
MEEAMGRFDHNTDDDTLTVEITDLDPHRPDQHVALQGVHHWPLFWRVVMLGATFFLTLVLILGALPSVRSYLWQVLVPVPPGSIVIGATSSTVAALQSSNGRLLWHVQVNGSVLSTPTVSNGVAYLGTNTGDLYALRVADGTLLWHFADRGLISSWEIHDGIIYVPSADPDALYALRASTGNLLWQVPTDGSLSPSLVILQGVIYGVTASLPSVNGQSASTVSAWRAQDGVLLWHHQLFPSSPVQLVGVDDNVYVSAATAPIYHLYALRASDGTLLWQDQIDDLASSPVLANDTIYVASFDGMLSALRARDGSLLWHSQLGVFESSILATDTGGAAVVAANFASHTSFLSMLQGSTGSLLWRDQERALAFMLKEIKGNIYLAAEDGTLSALRARDGTLLWSRQFEGNTFQEIASAGPPFLDISPFPVEENNGTLVVYSQDSFGSLYALRERDGAPLWSTRISSSPNAGEAEP